MADRVLRAILTGSSASAVAAFEETSLAAGTAADESAGKMDEAGSKIGGIFHKLGNYAGQVFSPLGEALNQTGDKFDEAETKGKSFGQGLSTLGGATLLGVGAGLAVVGGEAVKMAIDYQAGTASLAASAGISMQAAKSIGDAFLNTAGTTIYSGAQIQTAYTGVAAQLGSVQGHALNSAQAMTVMKAAMDLAEGSGNSLGDSTTQLAKVMQTFGDGVSQAAAVSNVLFVTGQKTGLGIDGVSQAFVRLHTQLGAASPPMAQMGGLLVDLANHGMSGRGAVSAVSSAMNTLLKSSSSVDIAQQNAKTTFDQMTPSLQALARQYESGAITSSQFTTATDNLSLPQKNLVSGFISANTAVLTAQTKLKELGVTVDNSKGKFVGMSTVIAELHDKIQGESQAQQLATISQAFGATAASKMLAIVQAGPAAYDAATAAVSKAGAAHAAAAVQAQTLGHEFELVKSTVEDLVTKLGEKLLPIITDVTTFLAHHTIIFEVLAGVIATVLGGAVVAFAVDKVSTFVGGIGKMVGAVGEFATNLISQATVSDAALEGIGTTAETAAVETDAAIGSTGIGAILIGLGIAVTLLLTHWKQVWGGIKDAALTVWHFLDNDVFHPIADFFTSSFEPAIKTAETVWNTVWQAVQTVVDAAWNFIKSHLDLIAGIIFGPFGFAVAYIATHWSQVWGIVKSVAETVWHFLDNDVFHPIADFFTSVWKTTIDTAKDAWHIFWTGVQSVVQTVWSIIKPIIQDITSGIHAVSDAVHAVSGVIGGVAHGASSVLGGIGHVLGLASGGVVTRPTLAVVGEAGPEMVLPLSVFRGASLDGANVAPLPSLSMGAIGAAGVSGDTYNITVVCQSADPQAVVNALRTYMQRNGAVPIRTAA